MIGSGNSTFKGCFPASVFGLMGTFPCEDKVTWHCIDDGDWIDIDKDDIIIDIDRPHCMYKDILLI